MSKLIASIRVEDHPHLVAFLQEIGTQRYYIINVSTLKSFQLLNGNTTLKCIWSDQTEEYSGDMHIVLNAAQMLENIQYELGIITRKPRIHYAVVPAGPLQRFTNALPSGGPDDMPFKHI